MIRPESIPVYNEVDLKLGIKSSLPHVKSAVALSILFWECCDYPTKLDYSIQDNDEIKITEELKENIFNYIDINFRDYNINHEYITNVINENQLFKSQIESLIVAFELIWKLAKISFTDISKSASSERTGMSRYPKSLYYTANMDIIHSVIINNKNEYMRVLLAWIGIDIGYNNELEKNLIYILNTLSESAVFKLTDGDKDVIFNQKSIYDKVISTTEEIDINGDKESKGSLRILKSLLSDDLNPYLQYSNGKVSIKNEERNNLDKYVKRVETLLKLSNVKIPNNNSRASILPIRFKTGYNSEFHRNRIIFGAPGTGKSYTLNRERKELLGEESEDNYERVTFHPDYSYANFVGTYKPVPSKDSEGNEVITYKYVPGPFMRIYVEALKNSKTENVKPYLLIIEEINRAKVSAVFGDVFQLLDRGDDEVSEYPIEASEDIKNYLAEQLGGKPQDYKKIYIPDNMFIWATMNSADQGVFPMDTAFKRRWNFKYLGINEKEEDIKNKYITLGNGSYKRRVEWNELRNAINDKLASFKVNEDKLIGPYFLSKKILKTENDEIDANIFIRTFKGKVLMYLFDDAAKQKRSSLFAEDVDTTKYSSVCEAFDKKGVFVFCNDISNNFTEIIDRGE